MRRQYMRELRRRGWAKDPAMAEALERSYQSAADPFRAKLGTPDELVTTTPHDYLELGIQYLMGGRIFIVSLRNFLNTFYLARSPLCFREEPPMFLSRDKRALLAGIAEYLCREYELEIPLWVYKSEYYMPYMDYWSKKETKLPVEAQVFLDRNIYFHPHHLITI